MEISQKAFHVKLLFVILLVNIAQFSGAAKSKSCNSKTNYQCEGGLCIPIDYRCNGIQDCPNSDDEKNCDEFRCNDKEKFFKCRDSETCIGKDLICDGSADCPDASDEGDTMCLSLGLSVTAKPLTPCDNATEFRCKNGACIPKDYVCNGEFNCADKTDEEKEMCKARSKDFKCPGFICNDGTCLVSHDFVCDGNADCPDGSDESHCTPNCELSDNKFLCGDECISLDKVCDGKFDCKDKSDEDDKCDKKTCETLKCEFKCLSLPTGPQCICQSGFFFNSTSKKCEDINECDKFGICSHGCVNKIGSYYCTCAPGFALNRDNKSCDSIGQSPELIFTTPKAIKKVKLDSNFHEMVSKAKMPVGVAFDGENYYWTEISEGKEVIAKMSSLPNAKKEILFSNGLEIPEYICVDWLTKNIYFTDASRRHIAVCTNDGYSCTELVKTDFISAPRGIALHPMDALLFWSDWGNDSHIGVSYMDGSNARVLVSNVAWPNGLALDWPNGRLYWVDASFDTIESVKITGEDRRTVLKGIVNHPFAIAVYGDRLYWSDTHTKTIEYCNKFTGKNQDVLVQGDIYYDVHIFDSSLIPNQKHACSENRCSHICLLSSNNSYTCACPMNMELIDKFNCALTSKAYSILIGMGPFLIESEYQVFGRHPQSEAKRYQHWFDRMAYSPINGDVFYADNHARVISVIDSKRESRDLVTNHIMQVTSLSFDYYGNNLYWCDALKATIEVISLTTKQRGIIQHFTGDYILAAIAVAPLKAEMFVVLRSSQHTHIDRISIRGDMSDEHFHVIETGLSNYGPFHLAVDEDGSKVYWSDAKNQKIEFSNFDGSNRKLFAQGGGRGPGTIAVVGDDLYWTSFNSKTLQWRNKTGKGQMKISRFESPKGLDDADFPQIINIVAGSPRIKMTHICSKNNGGCSDICLSDTMYSRVCKCAPGRIFRDSQNQTCIDRTVCDYRCSSGECIESKKKCDGTIDCLSKEDEDPKICKELKCTVEEFKCADNSRCIPISQKCDKNANCNDHSDELNCSEEDSKPSCGAHQIQCPGTSKCIYKTQVCDYKKDCADGYDETEAICSVPCPKDYFKCKSGQCIPKEFECNMHIECVDGSDEHDGCSSKICNPPKKPCRDGFCINSNLFCDGIPNCADGFDEIGCGNLTALDTKKCDLTEFQCPSNGACIPMKRKCDSRFDCPKGEDEVNCDKCPGHMFECDNGQCISWAKRCDGLVNCKDHSDEKDCGATTPFMMVEICTPGNYRCSDGICIDYKRVCDGVEDCYDDESPKCNDACVNNNGCDQICKKTPKGGVCDCRNGYELKGKGSKVCQDIDECATLNPCSQECINTEGSFFCSCYPGYVMTLNMFDCKALGSPKKMFYTLSDDIYMVTDTSMDVYSGDDVTIADIAYDARANSIMFMEYGESEMVTMNLDTKEKQSMWIPFSDRMIYDWISENIYITHGVNRKSIYVCNMKSQKCVLIKKFVSVYLASMDIDPVNKWIFIVQKAISPFNVKSEIVRMKLDGSDAQTIFADYLIEAIAVDINRKSVFILEKNLQALISIDYNGSNQKTIVHQSKLIQKPVALALFEDHAYIMDQASSKISKCKLYGNHECVTLDMHVGSAHRFIIGHRSKQIMAKNVCENHSCEEICMPLEYGRKCLCSGSNNDTLAVECKERERSEVTQSAETSSSSSSILWTVLVIGAIAGIGYLLMLAYRKTHFRKSFNITLGFRDNQLVNEMTPKPMPPPPTIARGLALVASAPTYGVLETGTIGKDLDQFKSCENMENFSDEELESLDIVNDDPSLKLIV